ncbi:olfactory receptor 11A1-like [Embiotoca jacksoni]|uniref:olfactory receptor 11A1-like n=1 Tax=Embiotoca jacksoni TaxID=100190 RepID=UPI003703BDB5
MRMKINSTQVSYFTLSAYFDSGFFKYFYVAVIMCLYVVIVVSNVFLLVVICVNRSLHEPMYLFLCSLLVNELYGSSGLFPFLLLQILSDVHSVPAAFCFLQVFCLHSYACVEFSSLAVMSYDRHLAICSPLQYNARMTSRKVSVLVALTWFYPVIVAAVTTALSSSLQLCGNVIDQVFCGNYAIVQLSCSDTTAHNVYGLFTIVLTLFVPVILILFSYVRIFKVCFSGSKQTRQKAVGTCTPHLASLLNFSFGCAFQIFQGRLDVSSVPKALLIVLSLYVGILQPILNPIMFGIQMSKIRNACKDLLCNKTFSGQRARGEKQLRRSFIGSVSVTE